MSGRLPVPGADRARPATRAVRPVAVLLAVFGLPMLAGGAWLAVLGGSWYYLLAGAASVVAAALLWQQRPAGSIVFLATYAFTVGWALWETGFAYWPAIPRLFAFTVLALLVLWIRPAAGPVRPRGATAVVGVAAATLAGLLVTLTILLFLPHDVTRPAATGPAPAVAPAAVRDWAHYGATAEGTRFVPFTEIGPQNVAKLKVAWTFRSGDEGPGEDQNVPLQIGATLYTCSRSGRVAALDVDTGAVRWRFDPQATSPVWQRCRGLGYHDAAAGQLAPAETPCRRRLLQTTIDARLLAIDAKSGQPCADFGSQGSVDLRQGMGQVPPGYYFQTSAPLVARNKVIVGGWVIDNQSRGEPSGVVRAFDVATGALAWAWDLGNPGHTREPAAGETYTRGTPNMWSAASFDDILGLVYLPLGNETPDYFGAGRHPQSERYASSIVAVDIETGRERWHFQTVHHDLWDYDVPSQPALVDVPDGKGAVVRALLQTTKRGQIFLLDRATGQPLAPVVEKPVPQTGQVAQERLAPTQPYSVGMPAIGTEPLTEAMMWGATPIDQLWCRIAFRQHRYDGEFTPPGLTKSLQYPGNFGGFNWGSTSYNPHSGHVFMNDSRLPVSVQLHPRDQMAAVLKRHPRSASGHGPAEQRGTPYGVVVRPMLSPLGVPCKQPPYGTITALDLATRTVAWQVPAGTVRDIGPVGLPPMRVGMPTIGGTIATASGLVFFAGYQDFYIRALDARNGNELWRHRLPVGSGSTPMSYVSPTTGKQFVVISAGGAPGSPRRGDYVIAYAL